MKEKGSVLCYMKNEKFSLQVGERVVWSLSTAGQRLGSVLVLLVLGLLGFLGRLRSLRSMAWEKRKYIVWVYVIVRVFVVC